jgi:hypothetical protein
MAYFTCFELEVAVLASSQRDPTFLAQIRTEVVRV